MKITSNTLKQAQAGVGLLEVLIVMVVMGVGLMGLAKLQLSTNQTNTTAYLNTQATIHIEEMIGRLRSDKLAAINGDYNVSLTKAASITTGASIAKQGRYNWAQNLSNNIPNPKVAISCNNSGLCLVAIKYTGSQGEKEQVLVAQL